MAVEPPFIKVTILNPEEVTATNGAVPVKVAIEFPEAFGEHGVLHILRHVVDTLAESLEAR